MIFSAPLAVFIQFLGIFDNFAHFQVVLINFSPFLMIFVHFWLSECHGGPAQDEQGPPKRRRPVEFGVPGEGVEVKGATEEPQTRHEQGAGLGRGKLGENSGILGV